MFPQAMIKQLQPSYTIIEWHSRIDDGEPTLADVEFEPTLADGHEDDVANLSDSELLRFFLDLRVFYQIL